ncbi:helix-turn-helix domain-containing protein [Streptomyces griseorubiginosus]
MRSMSRSKTLIGRRLHKSYTVQGVAALLKRHGWSCQGPARRAIERDEAAVAGWVKESWPDVEGPWRRSTPGSSAKASRILDEAAHYPHLVSAAAMLPSSGSGGAPAAVSRWPPCPATSPDHPPS